MDAFMDWKIHYRDAAQMFALSSGLPEDDIADRRVSDLPDILGPGDVLHGTFDLSPEIEAAIAFSSSGVSLHDEVDPGDRPTGAGVFLLERHVIPAKIV